MPRYAYFGQPAQSFVPNGAHIAIYLIPVYQGRLVVFDVAAKAARGRWLPWDILEFGGNPWETASALTDDWCGGNIEDLTLVDAMSFPFEGNGWELAIVYRAELTEPPQADDVRKPFLYERGQFDAIGNFDPVDLQRWVEQSPLDEPRTGSVGGLVF
jgi:hypothetical protein